MARLAFFLDDAEGRRDLESGFFRVRRGQAAAVPQALGDDVVFLYGGAAQEGRFAGVGRLAGLRPIDGDREVLRLEVDALRQLHAPTLNLHEDGPQLMELTEAQFAVLREQLGDVSAWDAEGLAEAQSPYLPQGIPAGPTLNAIIESAKRDAGNFCALTGEVLDPLVPQIAIIRPKTSGGASHANNLLILSRDAEEAFTAGHFTVRDDFRLIVDWSRLKPALRGRINATGRLTVSTNPALQPSPDNLDYHRRFVFGLG